MIWNYYFQTTSLILTDLLTEIVRTVVQRRQVRGANAKPIPAKHLLMNRVTEATMLIEGSHLIPSSVTLSLLYFHYVLK